MHEARPRTRHSRTQNGLRIAWLVVRVLALQSAICGAAALVPMLAIQFALQWAPPSPLLRAIVMAVLAAPAYVAFAILLMLVSGAACRLLQLRTPRDLEMRIDELGAPLLRWAEYIAAIHVVRFFAGGLLRGSPLWTAYLRLAGARLGRRVYVNSLDLSDYNLLEFGDDVVIGADAHVAGHTVERGVVKTGAVRLGSRVVVGIDSIIDIGAEVGDGCQIGAMSFVPKYAKLAADSVYGGIPVRLLSQDQHARVPPRQPG
jgi:acetyltransferase-like isoleucine patch superfamily enzyme